MANAEVNLSNKLADRILQEARGDAEKTMLSAEEEIRSIQDDWDRKASEYKSEAESARNSAVQSVIDGCLTRASLDGRKALLFRKRKVIDRVFDDTYQKLLELPDSAKASIYTIVLKKEAEAGDTVVSSKSDRSIVECAIRSLPELELKLADGFCTAEGGFLILGNGYEKIVLCGPYCRICVILRKRM